jgi:perosamine synthetase
MNQIGVGTFKTTPRMRELVGQVLDSERISYGPMSKKFEQEFAAIHDSAYAVWSNSGTSSLVVAIQALKELHGWNDGDEVLVPAVTFVATVNAVVWNRLTPVLVDVEPLYYGIDPMLIERAITPRTRAIVPVHLFGQPCDMTAIKEIADRHHLLIVEDSCECMFVRHNSKMVGSWGDISCFSTYVAHLLTTGVGGLSVTDNPDYAVAMRSLVNHGRDGIYISIDDDHGLSGAALKEVISRRFRFERVGHSFRITELEAALGLAQLEDWQAMIATRQANAIYFIEHLHSYEDRLQLPAVRPNTDHAWMMLPLVLRYSHKESLCQWLEERGIETREMLPLTNQPVYNSWCNESQYPVAQWINQSGFYVGVHQDLTTNNLDYMAEMISDYFEQKKLSRSFIPGARGSLSDDTLNKVEQHQTSAL